MYNSQNPDELYGYLCNPQQGGMEGFQNTTYTCPEGWNQVAEDSQNGLCRTSCDTFNYGPKYGGYPTNRRPAQTRCVDLRNGSDQSGAWKDRSNTWPPSAQAQVVAPPSNTYDNGVTYKQGDQVTFNGSLYRLNRFIGAAGYAPSNKPQNWDNLTNPALNYKEGQPYSNDILYDAGNTVTLNGTGYRLKEFIGGAGYAPLANPNWVSLNPVGPPIPTSVTVYEHCDKAGWARSLIGARVFKAGADFPLNASYIFVPPGFRATIYTGDQNGRSKVINGNEAFVFCSEGGWANDNIRSIVVTAV
jgi:hypothetical protein